MSATNEPSGKVFRVELKDKAAVYNCHMSFLKDAGFFIPTNEAVSLGDLVFLAITLPDSADMHLVSGKIVWINTQLKRKGFGVRMSNDPSSVKFKTAVENILGGTLKSQNPTYTM